MAFFIQFCITGVLVGFIYSLVALAFVLIYKSSKVINFAQGQMVMIGAFITWWLVSVGLNLWQVIIIGAVICMLIGVVIQRFGLQRLTGQPLLSLIMATIALSAILQAVPLMVWGASPKVFPAYIHTGIVNFGPFFASTMHLWSLVVVVAVFGLLSYFFYRSKRGLQMRTVAESHSVAQSMGLNVNTIFIWTWGIAGVIGMAAGFLMGNIFEVNPILSDYGLKAFPVILLGGMESIGGCLIAGPIIGLAEQLTAAYLDPLVGGGLSGTVPFIIMIIILFFKPFGLFGEERIERI